MKKNNIQIQIDELIIAFVGEKNIEADIEKIVKGILKEQKINASCISVSIQSATREEIQTINKEYRNIDAVTDVLSFPIFDREEWDTMRNNTNDLQALELGDIILCLDVIREQAQEYGTGILRETVYMITHGMCHLMGFDHEIESEKMEMRALEEKILNQIGVCR